MDMFGDVLSSLNIFSSSVGKFEVAEPWCFSVPALPPNFTFFFFVIEGRFSICVEDADPLEMLPGSALLLLGGREHKYGSDLTSDVLSLDEIWQARGLPSFGDVRNEPVFLQWGDGEEITKIFTLGLTIQDPEHHPLLNLLPSYIYLPETMCGRIGIWVDAALAAFRLERSEKIAGFSCSAKYTTELIVAEVMRSYFAKIADKDFGWLKGFNDKRIGMALSIMHTRSDEQWTVPLLAEEVSMARSTFARVFQQLVGQSPIDYLLNCRMKKAEQLLVEGKLSISQLAETVGYSSERAFRQAFYQRFGMAPRKYLKQKRKI